MTKPPLHQSQRNKAELRELCESLKISVRHRLGPHLRRAPETQRRGEEPERRDAGAGEETGDKLTSCEQTSQVTNRSRSDWCFTTCPKRRRHSTVTAETEGDEEEVTLTSATTKRMRVTSESCGLAATAGQRLKARKRSRVRAHASASRVKKETKTKTIKRTHIHTQTNKQTNTVAILAQVPRPCAGRVLDAKMVTSHPDQEPQFWRPQVCWRRVQCSHFRRESVFSDMKSRQAAAW